MSATAERVRELFDDAADLPPSRREAFLAEACAGDDALAAEVRALLAYAGAPTPAVTPAGSEPAATAIPAALGRFEVRGKLGEGGMGVVYRAYDRTLEREVALKLVNARGGADARARLVREAQAMARVAHPHVVPIYDVGTDDEHVFIAMELVRGTTLTAWLRAAPRPWRDTLRLLVEAGRGLAAAHRAGLLHRDVKPDNILVGEDGRARIVDFGLARAARADEVALAELAAAPDDGPAAGGVALELTRAGAVVGTPGFMSPEQLDGLVTPLADQWSFAATAYHALFGRLPWTGADLAALREAVTTTAPAPPPPTDVPPAVTAAIVRGLRRFPDERFASMAALLDELAAALAVDPDEDRHRFRRQRRRLAMATIVIGAITAGAAGLRTDFRYDLDVGQVLVQGLIGMVAMIVMIALFRRALWRTAHDRRVMSMFVLVMATVSAHRLISLDRDVVDVLRADAITVAGILVLGAIAVERWSAFAALAMLAQLAFSLAVPRLTVPSFPVALLGSLAVAIWSWREPARPPVASPRPGATGPDAPADRRRASPG